MAFLPDAFLATAKKLANGTGEADHRTAIGRAYYAPYGHVRERLAAAHQTTAARIFGKSGKHTPLAGRLGRTTPFKLVAPLYNALMTGRIHADYLYSATLGKQEATKAVANGEWVLSKLKGFDDKEYARITLPL